MVAPTSPEQFLEDRVTVVSGRIDRRKFSFFPVAVFAIAAIADLPAKAQDAITTVAVGTNPSGVALSPVANKIHVANDSGDDVTVIDGAMHSGIPGAPALEFQPQSQTVGVGTPVALNATIGTSSATYQWLFNGVPVSDGNGISGSSTSTLYLSGGATLGNAGTYSCMATNSMGSVSSGEVALTIIATPSPGRLINLSSRAFVGTGANILVAGFVVRGGGSKTLILRGVGPTLTDFGIHGTLPTPVLWLYDAANPANLITYDSGWQNAPSVPAGPWIGKATPIDATAADFAQVGAFGFTSGSIDSAIKITVPAGSYTTQIVGGQNDQITGTAIVTGVALAEVYDADAGNPNTALVNISARAIVGIEGSSLVAGFVISGSTSQTVLIRASGPALGAFGVLGTLPDPQLQLFDGNQNLIASNFAWGGNSQIASAASNAGAFPWNNPSSDDSAILVTLPPGNYTAQASSESGDTGVALIEVYVVPAKGQ